MRLIRDLHPYRASRLPERFEGAYYRGQLRSSPDQKSPPPIDMWTRGFVHKVHRLSTAKRRRRASCRGPGGPPRRPPAGPQSTRKLAGNRGPAAAPPGRRLGELLQSTPFVARPADPRKVRSRRQRPAPHPHRAGPVPGPLPPRADPVALAAPKPTPSECLRPAATKRIPGRAGGPSTAHRECPAGRSSAHAQRLLAPGLADFRRAAPRRANPAQPATPAAIPGPLARSIGAAGRATTAATAGPRLVPAPPVDPHL
jgi:hypothetical protein